MSVLTHTTVRRGIAALTLTASVGGVGLAATQSANAASAPAANRQVAASAAMTVQPRTAIPWKSVGPGWVAADVVRGKVKKLVLVSPAGQPYEIATLGQDENVTQISQDGKHVLTMNWRKNRFTPRVWDLQTGKVAALPYDLINMTFTRPSGSSVQGFNENNTYSRYSTSGAQQKLVVEPGGPTQKLYTLTSNPNGLTEAVTVSDANGSTRVSLYSHANFTKQRTYSLPAGVQSCGAAGWQDTTTLLETCVTKSLGEAYQTHIYAQKINGGAPVALTTGTAPGSDAYRGYSWVAKTSVGTVALAQNSDPGAYDSSVYLMGGTRAKTAIKPPSLNANGGDYAGGLAEAIIGDKIVYASTPLGDNTTKRMVAEYDVKTKKLVYLVGNNSGYTGQVGSYAVIDPRS